MSETSVEFRQGVIDIAPVIVAATPIGLLWGTLAAGKGLSPLEAGLTSVTVLQVLRNSWPLSCGGSLRHGCCSRSLYSSSMSGIS